MAAVCLGMFIAAARANHGPGTSGGGSATISGETLKPGAWDLSLRTDYTDFQNVSQTSANRRAVRGGEFDSLDYSVITSVSAAVGVIEDLQLSASIGYYNGENFVDTESAGGDVESGTADPSGLTDLALDLKYRFIHNRFGSVAAIGGVILPTGRDDVRLNNGDLLEASSQPGTGAVSWQIGLAWSRFLTSRVSADVSGLYTIRMEHDDFKVGDRVDLGAALAYRLTESIASFPNTSVFVEANAIWLGKDDDNGEKNPNSGGWTLYISPGFRVRWTENLATTVAASLPVSQDLNGEQIETDFKLALTLSLSF